MTRYVVYTKEKGKIETDKGDDFNVLTWHREDGPAYQVFYDNRQIHYTSYYINGKWHRLDGPAFQAFYDNGQLWFEAYYINGKHYSKTDYDVELFKMKLALL